ncbi:DUF5134 domain-containing protein [Nocardia sp. CA-107356]|uniref:DUF5134 domain-containing protein n=1 Tax=Nocardia sp. CA-107356 TaxID=3239972 RepID=UPI003D8C26DE
MEFAQEYAALRWSVVVAFLFASVVVLGRLAAPAGGMRRMAGECGDDGAVPLVVVGNAANSGRPQANSMGEGAVACHESDAAHLIMCLVMLAMLIFPAGANPVALRGVLLAMIVVFAALLVDRIVEWRSAARLVPGDRMVALGYHIIVAFAMLYAISGHGADGHTGGPTPVPALALAALFAVDAIALIVAASTGRRQRWLGHPIGASTGSVQLSSAEASSMLLDTARSGSIESGSIPVAQGEPDVTRSPSGPAGSVRTGSLASRALSSAMVPHIVMDLGTAYMLIAAVSG